MRYCNCNLVYMTNNDSLDRQDHNENFYLVLVGSWLDQEHRSPSLVTVMLQYLLRRWKIVVPWCDVTVQDTLCREDRRGSWPPLSVSDRSLWRPCTVNLSALSRGLMSLCNIPRVFGIDEALSHVPQDLFRSLW